jgi:hypothetical protein
MTLFMTATLVVSGAKRQDRNARKSIEGNPLNNAIAKIDEGRQTFRFDTFGDEAFWGDTLKLHQAVEGAAHGGVGPGLTPRAAFAAGLKVDIDVLPGQVREQFEKGAIDLQDPSVTLALLKLNAVVGLTGFFSSSLTLRSIGVQCALCHSTVDNSHPLLCAGAVVPDRGTGCIGHRLDAWANRDLNVGAIIALAPDLSPFATLLRAEETAVRHVLQGWGPGRFDGRLLLDGTVPGAALIPPTFGSDGLKMHTWTGWLGTLPRISPDDERKDNLAQYLSSLTRATARASERPSPSPRHES